MQYFSFCKQLIKVNNSYLINIFTFIMKIIFLPILSNLDSFSIILCRLVRHYFTIATIRHKEQSSTLFGMPSYLYLALNSIIILHLSY